jgi:glycosyltransferase involved in cell wall biosynthesis
LAGEARGADRLHAHFAGEAAEWARAAAMLAGVPFSVTVHAVDLFKPRPGLAEVLHDARPAVTVSRYSAAILKERYRIDAPVVRCGVDPDRYPPARPGDPGALRVIAVGRGVPKKGFDLLAAAIAGVDADLHLVSDAAIAGPRIHAGLLPPSAVPRALASAHVFALPCRRAPDGDQDNVPVAMIEAMAAGLPVLTTHVGGIPEVVDEEVGWVVPPDDVSALRRAILAIAGDPAERARRGAAARRRVVERGLTVDAQVDGLLAAWAAA